MRSDSMAILDSNFNVFGTKNLRVVDACVFPHTPGYFIALPIYMIAEKASDVIIAAAERAHSKLQAAHVPASPRHGGYRT